MIEKLKLLEGIARKHCNNVIVGDATVHNLLSDSARGTICFIYLPKARIKLNAGIKESVSLVFRVMKKSVLDECFDDELNILSECESIAKLIIKSMDCPIVGEDIELVETEFKLKETDNLLSGIEVRISFSGE